MSESMRKYEKGMFVGHFPKKYNYDKRLPKPLATMSWINMFNKTIQNCMFKSADKQREGLNSLKAPNGFNIETYDVAVSGGNIKMYMIEPKELTGKKNVPVIFNTHGGGFYFPLGCDEVYNSGYFAKQANARVFLPDYRTSIEKPFPTPFMDCVESFMYMINNADSLGIDKNKIVLFGGSAGACLATGLALYLRDHSDIKVKGQVLLIPVTDNDNHYESNKLYEDAVWSENANEHCWSLYLPNEDVDMLEYGVPMKNKDLSNLPPAYVEVSEMDLLRDQGLAYAKRMQDAGVNVETKIIKGGYHGCTSDQSNPYVQEIIKYEADKIVEFLNAK